MSVTSGGTLLTVPIRAPDWVAVSLFLSIELRVLGSLVGPTSNV